MIRRVYSLCRCGHRRQDHINPRDYFAPRHGQPLPGACQSRNCDCRRFIDPAITPIDESGREAA